MLILNGPLGVISTKAALIIGKIGLSPMTEIQIVYTGPIVKRADAMALGLTHYFTGKPCKWMHVDKRFVSNSGCRSCNDVSLEYQRIWASKNPEKTREKTKRQMKRTIELQRKRRKDNPLKYLEKSREYRCKNKETYRAYGANRRSRIKSVGGSHNGYDIKEILNRQKYKCAEPTCSVSISSGYHVDHIMPISLGGSNNPHNLQCLCQPCNTKKSAKHPIVWARENGRLI